MILITICVMVLTGNIAI